MVDPICPSVELILSRLSTDSSVRGLYHFSLPEVHNTSTLLLSDDGSTLYVGARNAILSLNVSDPKVINLKAKVGQDVIVGGATILVGGAILKK